MKVHVTLLPIKKIKFGILKSDKIILSMQIACKKKNNSTPSIFTNKCCHGSCYLELNNLDLEVVETV